MRVLIVDDSSTARRFLKKALPLQFLTDVVEADGARRRLEITRPARAEGACSTSRSACLPSKDLSK